jgi:hypothetical protein
MVGKRGWVHLHTSFSLQAQFQVSPSHFKNLQIHLHLNPIQSLSTIISLNVNLNLKLPFNTYSHDHPHHPRLLPLLIFLPPLPNPLTSVLHYLRFTLKWLTWSHPPTHPLQGVVALLWRGFDLGISLSLSLSPLVEPLQEGFISCAFFVQGKRMPRGVSLTFGCKGYPLNSWLYIMRFSFIGKEDAKREFLLHYRCKDHTHSIKENDLASWRKHSGSLLAKWKFILQ